MGKLYYNPNAKGTLDTKFLYSEKYTSDYIIASVENLYCLYTDYSIFTDTLFRMNNPLSDNLIIYHTFNNYYFNNEQDAILWRLKYGL